MNETNEVLLHTHTSGRGRIKLQQNSLKLEHATAISKNVLRERHNFTKGTEARRSNTTIMTTTPNVSRGLEANIH